MEPLSNEEKNRLTIIKEYWFKTHRMDPGDVEWLFDLTDNLSIDLQDLKVRSTELEKEVTQNKKFVSWLMKERKDMENKIIIQEAALQSVVQTYRLPINIYQYVTSLEKIMEV